MNDPIHILKLLLESYPDIKRSLHEQRRWRLFAGKSPEIARYFLWIAHPDLLRDWADRIERETKP